MTGMIWYKPIILIRLVKLDASCAVLDVVCLQTVALQLSPVYRQYFSLWLSEWPHPPPPTLLLIADNMKQCIFWKVLETSWLNTGRNIKLEEVCHQHIKLFSQASCYCNPKRTVLLVQYSVNLLEFIEYQIVTMITRRRHSSLSDGP